VESRGNPGIDRKEPSKGYEIRGNLKIGRRQKLEDVETGETRGLIERRHWKAEVRGNPEIRRKVEPKGREIRGNSKVRRQHSQER